MTLALVSVCSCLISNRHLEASLDDLKFDLDAKSELPDIILLSSDALLSSHMSVYGYERETTPFLASDDDSWLIYENAFSNANRSAGSVLAMLTGRSPLHTKIITYPDILRGQDSLSHFVGLIRSKGYRTLDISIRDYADAVDRNMCLGFDYATGRKLDQGLYSILRLSLIHI